MDGIDTTDCLKFYSKKDIKSIKSVLKKLKLSLTYFLSDNIIVSNKNTIFYRYTNKAFSSVAS